MADTQMDTKDRVLTVDKAAQNEEEELKSEIVATNLEKEEGTHDTNDESHDLRHHVQETEPWKIHIYVAKYPLSCCMFMCFWFLLCGVIIISVPGLLRFTTEVPFYMRDDTARSFQDALVAGQTDATWTRPDETHATARQQEEAAGVSLRLIYKVKDGHTLMTKEYLEIMDKIEDKIKSTNDYDAFCLRKYDHPLEDDAYTCARQTSLTNFFDPNYFKPSVDRNYSLDPTVIPNFKNYLLPSLFIDGSKPLENKDYDEAFVDQIVSYWASYDQGEGPPEPYAQKYYNQEKMPPKFRYMRQPQGTAYSVSNMFASLADKDFGYDTPLDTDVTTAMTLFNFGLPLDGSYDEKSVDDIEAQQDLIGKWCYEELHQVFVDFAASYEDKLEFYWSCSTMRNYYTQDILLSDMLFMIVTFLCVYILMINATGSVWLSSCGMAMIFMNFLPSLLLYRYIAQQNYFGTLQMMAMFIILSIGADNIFVIVDRYAQYRTAAPNQPMDKRLTTTLKHAGKVMATTSASTCFSFIANTTSVFPAVYTFGAFATFLVFVNYCAVVLFYPTVLAVHERYFYVPTLKRSCCISKTCASRCGVKCNTCCGMNNVDEYHTADELVKDGKLQEKKRGIDVFFEDKFYPFIQTQRRRILTLTLAIFLIFFAFAVRIEADPEPPQFYPRGNNYQEYLGALTDNFQSATGLKLSVNIVWGIEGIDRSGTDLTIPDDIGQVLYASNLSIESPEEQQYIAQFCDDLLCLHSDYNCRYSPNTYYDLQIADPENYGGARTNVVQCFMTEFREWVLTDPMAHPNDSDISELLEQYGIAEHVDVTDFDDCEYGVFPVEDKICFGLLFSLLWINDEMPTSNPDYTPGKTNYDYWKSSMFGKDDGDGAKLKFIRVTVLTEASIDTTPEDGMKLFDDWQTFGDNWKRNVNGHHSTDRTGENEFVETPTALQTIMITDPFLFSYYFVQNQIINEAVFGIGLSLLLAFIVLSLATGNWLIAMYSCFVIFAIVICVIGFTVMNGWKLGVIEAVIYVMVVGMAVDYVVHLSEAYLSSGKRLREDRAQRMLGIVGGSVLSGAVSTLLGIVWLFAATNFVFYKFGCLIFFLIATSCIMSLFSFTAAMSVFGPEGSSGDLRLAVKRLCGCIKGNKAEPEPTDTQQKRTDNIQMT
eukprot:179021_1